jgi:hypothetical protein
MMIDVRGGFVPEDGGDHDGDNAKSGPENQLRKFSADLYLTMVMFFLSI